ncbi:hypothetical protein Nepgr_020225 [Nepenthes gracilis]|uniref:Uncharacterized protein n=1 Tax=Nepenthes gracilis TaxID=150966 RepID=A0AAD3SWK3_NEPGR|nr:hypothetical protein Nepgr_020225 [Nepenthes gracilis]
MMHPVRYSLRHDYKRKPHHRQSHRRSCSSSRSQSPEFSSEARIGTMRLPHQSRVANQMDERSPVRLFGRGRMSLDDYSRPIFRGTLGRNPQEMLERFHPSIDYDGDGDAGQFQYDSEDMNAARGFRRADRRSSDVLGESPREGRGSTGYNLERTYYSGKKPLRMRGHSEEAQRRAI